MLLQLSLTVFVFTTWATSHNESYSNTLTENNTKHILRDGFSKKELKLDNSFDPSLAINFTNQLEIILSKNVNDFINETENNASLSENSFDGPMTSGPQVNTARLRNDSGLDFSGYEDRSVYFMDVNITMTSFKTTYDSYGNMTSSIGCMNGSYDDNMSFNDRQYLNNEETFFNGSQNMLENTTDDQKRFRKHLNRYINHSNFDKENLTKHNIHVHNITQPINKNTNNLTNVHEEKRNFDNGTSVNDNNTFKIFLKNLTHNDIKKVDNDVDNAGVWKGKTDKSDESGSVGGDQKHKKSLENNRNSKTKNETNDISNEMIITRNLSVFKNITENKYVSRLAAKNHLKMKVAKNVSVDDNLSRAHGIKINATYIDRYDLTHGIDNSSYYYYDRHNDTMTQKHNITQTLNHHLHNVIKTKPMPGSSANEGNGEEGDGNDGFRKDGNDNERGE